MVGSGHLKAPHKQVDSSQDVTQLILAVTLANLGSTIF